MTDSLRSMISRRVSSWRKAAALAPVLLLLVNLPGQVMLRCRIDGVMRSTCCCSHGNEAKGGGPVIKAQSCCDQIAAQSQRPKAEAARSQQDALPIAADSFVAISLAQFVAPQLPALLHEATQRHGPAREGPQIVLSKHAFLI